jgi:hypothetical protein
MDHLNSCYLPCLVSCGPWVGGFLHPSCYGIPGINDITKPSLASLLRANHHLQWQWARHHDIICSRLPPPPCCQLPGSTSRLSICHPKCCQVILLELIPAGGCPSHGCTVGYIQSQLDYLDLFQDLDGGTSPYDPIRVGTTIVGQVTPALYPCTSNNIHTTDLWTPSPPHNPYFPDNGNCPQDDSLSTIMSTIASTINWHTLSSQ